MGGSLVRYDSRDKARTSWWRTPLLIFLVALLAVAAGVAIALFLDGPPGTALASPTPTSIASPTPKSNATPQASATATETPTSSQTPGATPSQDATATPVVHPPDDLLPRFSIGRVTADGLRIRTDPSTSAPLVATLAADGLVLVGSGPAHLAGPRAADGFTWYQVMALDSNVPMPPRGSWFELVDESEEVGWIAAGDGTSRFIETVPARCVAGNPSLELLDAWTPWERLSCLGDRPITFEGVYGCAGCGGFAHGEWKPEWLASPLNFQLISVDPNERFGPMDLRFPPDGPQPPEPGSIIRVTGHFDDPAATGCERALGEPAEPEDTQMAELYCRMQFVVENYEVIGTFEDFPTG